WRRMTPQERQAALTQRQRNLLPWHGPPHYVGESALYLVSAACYEHRPIIGVSAERMADFEAEMLDAARELAQAIFAWCGAAESLSFACACARSPRPPQRPWPITWPDFLSVERRRSLPRQNRVAPCCRNGNEVGTALLGDPQLCLAQPGKARVRCAM